MSSSPSSGLKRRRVESSGVTWIEAEFFPSAGPSRQARQAWDDDLPEQFEVVRSVGEGTFSTVWLARERNSTSESIYALKRVNPTCSPSRILNEYQQMRKLGGKHNVIQVHGLIRTDGGAFAMVMPYFEHDDFKAFIRTLTISGIAAYMRSLLTALAHVHAEGVIHRDIKPRNFMYSVEKQQGLLIDFGLAEPAGRWKSRIDALARHRAKRSSGRARSPRKGARRDTSLTPIAISQGERSGPRESEVGHTGEADDAGKPGGNAVGDESRAAESGAKAERVLLRKAERGGTTGFRAPEVLWHSRDQEPALDVWSAGVIFLCLLSRRYPVFPSADTDEMALVQIGTLCGIEQIQQAARESGRFDIVEFPAMVRRGSFEGLCAPLLGGPAVDSGEANMRRNALSLVQGMLCVDPRHRMTAKDALEHPFVSDA